MKLGKHIEITHYRFARLPHDRFVEIKKCNGMVTTSSGLKTDIRGIVAHVGKHSFGIYFFTKYHKLLPF